MNIKRILTFGFVGASLFTLHAQEETPVPCNVPGPLSYENAVVSGNFFTADACAIGASLTYTLNVATAGDYLLYLSYGDKTKAQGVGFDIQIDGDTVEAVEDMTNYGGNWNVFIMTPFKLTLPAGESTLSIVSTSDRWNMNPDVAPMVLPANSVLDVPASGTVDVDVLYPAPESTVNFLTYSAFGVDNSGFGSSSSVLVTGEDYSTQDGSKTQSPYAATNLLYLINVADDSIFEASVTGFYTPAREKDGSWYFPYDEVEGFDINLDVIDPSNNSLLKSNTIDLPEIDLTDSGNIAQPLDEGTGQGGQTIDVTGTGLVDLPAGTNLLSISTSYPYNDTFNLKSLSLSYKSSGVNSVSVASAIAYTVSEDGVDVKVAEVSKVAVYDLTGKVIYSNNAFNGGFIPVAGNGVYMLSISNNSGTVNKKFVK